MSLIIPPGFGLAAFVLTGPPGTQPYITTLGVTLTLGTYTAVEHANACHSAYASAWLPRTNNELTLDRVQLYVGDDGPSGSVDSDNAPVQGGVSSANFPPTAQSAIMRKVTNNLGRRGRGRMFMPGVVGEADVTSDGTLIPAARTSLNANGDTFLAALADTSAIPMEPVLFHSTAPADPSPIVNLIVSDTVGWIRGRIR